MEQLAPKDWFEIQLRKTLNGLYDPGVLINSPLLQLFTLSGKYNTASALRRFLTESIESLKPGPTTPIDAQTWRIYQILRRRYIEQLTQQQVAADMGLSVRQLQRCEKLARQVLTEQLWSAYNLECKIPKVQLEYATDMVDHMGPPSMAQELAWLHDTVPAQSVSLIEILSEIIEVLSPLMQDSGITAQIEEVDQVPEVYVKLPLVRQAVLNILNTAVLCSISNTPVHIKLTSKNSDVVMTISTICATHVDKVINPDVTDSISMAQTLINHCQGEITFSGNNLQEVLKPDAEFIVSVILPAQESIDVLVVDDNADVLQLFERYLVGTRYRLRGTQDPQEGLQLAKDGQPAAILLDVMMPGQDGWTLLGQLREHPKTQHIPIIVCSILSQEKFALALGAVDFLRKPVTRQAFLEVLDRLLDQPLKVSD